MVVCLSSEWEILYRELKLVGINFPPLKCALKSDYLVVSFILFGQKKLNLNTINKVSLGYDLRIPFWKLKHHFSYGNFWDVDHRHSGVSSKTVIHVR